MSWTWFPFCHFAVNLNVFSSTNPHHQREEFANTVGFHRLLKNTLKFSQLLCVFRLCFRAAGRLYLLTKFQISSGSVLYLLLSAWVCSQVTSGPVCTIMLTTNKQSPWLCPWLLKVSKCKLRGKFLHISLILQIIFTCGDGFVRQTWGCRVWGRPMFCLCGVRIDNARGL